MSATSELLQLRGAGSGEADSAFWIGWQYVPAGSGTWRGRGRNVTSADAGLLTPLDELRMAPPWGQTGPRLAGRISSGI